MGIASYIIHTQKTSLKGVPLELYALLLTFIALYQCQWQAKGFHVAYNIIIIFGAGGTMDDVQNAHLPTT